MAGSDLKLNKIGFNWKSCMDSLIRVADSYMQETEDTLIRLFRYEIDKNGNGSSEMKSAAKKAIHEILHEVTDNKITIEAGFDPELAHSMATDFYVKAMVVFYGNMSEGHIHTKPGAYTWRKHVRDYHLSTAKSRYYIPQFSQRDVSQHIQDNVMKQIEKYFKVMLIRLNEFTKDGFYEQFITVG